MLVSPRVMAVVGALAVGAAAVACGGASLDTIEPAVGVMEVSVLDNRFEPRVIEVEAGVEVTWDFAGRRDHNVVGGGWGSDVMREGTFSHTFEAAGTHNYLCTLHGGMSARVLVVEAP
ncbi:MAG: hypothetical protein WD800_02280 [Dehalococcoidia bacterium]